MSKKKHQKVKLIERENNEVWTRYLIRSLDNIGVEMTDCYASSNNKFNLDCLPGIYSYGDSPINKNNIHIWWEFNVGKTIEDEFCEDFGTGEGNGKFDIEKIDTYEALYKLLSSYIRKPVDKTNIYQYFEEKIIINESSISGDNDGYTGEMSFVFIQDTDGCCLCENKYVNVCESKRGLYFVKGPLEKYVKNNSLRNDIDFRPQIVIDDIVKHFKSPKSEIILAGYRK